MQATAESSGVTRVAQTGSLNPSKPAAQNPPLPPSMTSSQFWEITRLALIALASLGAALLVGAVAMSIALLPAIAAKLGTFGVITFGIIGTGGTGLVCYYFFNLKQSAQAPIPASSSGQLPLVTVNRIQTQKNTSVPTSLMYADDKFGNSRRLTPKELMSSLTRATSAMLSSYPGAGEDGSDLPLQDRIRKRSLSKSLKERLHIQIPPRTPGTSPQTTLEAPITPSPKGSPSNTSPASDPTDALAMLKEPAPVTDHIVTANPVSAASTEAASKLAAITLPTVISPSAALSAALSVLPASVSNALNAIPVPLPSIQALPPLSSDPTTLAVAATGKKSLRATLGAAISSIAARRSSKAQPAATPPTQVTEAGIVKGIYDAINKSTSELGLEFFGPVLRQLLSMGSKPGCLDASKVFSVIEKAASSQNFDDVVDPMLKLIDVTATDDKGETVLFKFLKTDKLTDDARAELVRRLFARDAAVNHPNKFGETPVHVALTTDVLAPKTLQVIVSQKGVDLNRPFPRGKNCLKTPEGEAQWRIIPKGSYPLHEAIRLKQKGLVDLELIRSMVTAGADINRAEETAKKAPIKFTPLSLALHLREKDVVDHLCSAHVTIDKAMISLAHPGNRLMNGDDSFQRSLKQAAATVAVSS